jgi:hypothetical protein
VWSSQAHTQPSRLTNSRHVRPSADARRQGYRGERDDSCMPTHPSDGFTFFCVQCLPLTSKSASLRRVTNARRSIRCTAQRASVVSPTPLRARHPRNGRRGCRSADPPTSPIPVRDCKSTKYQSKHFPPHACVAAQVAAVLRARAYSPCVAAAEIRATQRLIVADKVVAAQVRAKHVER